MSWKTGAYASMGRCWMRLLTCLSSSNFSKFAPHLPPTDHHILLLIVCCQDLMGAYMQVIYIREGCQQTSFLYVFVINTVMILWSSWLHLYIYWDNCLTCSLFTNPITSLFTCLLFFAYPRVPCSSKFGHTQKHFDTMHAFRCSNLFPI